MKLFSNLNFEKLKSGLSKTRDKIFTRINETITGKAKLDSEVLDEIEEILLTSDVGYDTSMKIVEELKRRLKGQNDRGEQAIIESVKGIITDLFHEAGSDKDYQPAIEAHKPFVILVIGINGAGKTTTIGKLAYNFRNSGLKVLIGAGDTFRAAANQQLDVWAERAGVQIVQKNTGADPSSVVYDTVKKGVEERADVVIIDTAGRLHTKTNLMEELKKINRSIQKILPSGPHESFLVLDGTTGQNALTQVEEFGRTLSITGLIVTKLDGTAKGGAVIQICDKQKQPIRYIGVGEGIDDLQTFSPREFVDAIFSSD